MGPRDIPKAAIISASMTRDRAKQQCESIIQRINERIIRSKLIALHEQFEEQQKRAHEEYLQKVLEIKRIK